MAILGPRAEIGRVTLLCSSGSHLSGLRNKTRSLPLLGSVVELPPTTITIAQDEGGRFRPEPTAFSRAVLLESGRPKSAHTHNDAISRQGIAGCPLQFRKRFVQIRLRAKLIPAGSS